MKIPKATTLDRSECKVLPIVLKERWFDMVATGQAKEAYKDDSAHWSARILGKVAKKPGMPTVVEFKRGNGARTQRAAFLLGAEPFVRAKFRFLHPDWGEPCKAHWVLPLGGRVHLTGGGDGKEAEA